MTDGDGYRYLDRLRIESAVCRITLRADKLGSLDPIQSLIDARVPPGAVSG